MEIRDRDRLDQLLDSALHDYGDVEPRTGLEARILARLSIQNRPTLRRQWVLSFASAVIVCAVLFSIWRFGNIRKTRTDVAESPVAATAPTRSGVGSAIATPLAAGKDRRVSKVRRRAEHVSDIGTEALRATPRLQRFPSPRPISQAELTLAEYAARFPNEAQLVANDQEAFEEEIEEAQRKLQDENQSRIEER